jgi:hypothetical protein
MRVLLLPVLGSTARLFQHTFAYWRYEATLLGGWNKLGGF